MAAKLLVEEGDLKGMTLSLDEGDSWTIGHDPACQIVIEDPSVSPQHLVARRTPEGIIVENLNRTDPALLNDEAIDDQNNLLQNGDTLKIGNEVLRYYEDSSAQLLDGEISDLENQEEYEQIPEETPETHAETPETLEPTENEIVSTPENVDSSKPESESEKTMNDIQKTLSSFPSTYSPEAPERQDTHFDEDADSSLAEIDFSFIESGRWLLKVINGPNYGAEFSMQTGNVYTLGTDPLTCDLVFYDNSVSRQHARVSISTEDTLSIEDLNSRNGVLVNGEAITEKKMIQPSDIISLGTTSFVIYDREGEMKTIVSPFLLPSILKVLQQEVKSETPTETVQKTAAPVEAAPPPVQPAPPPPKQRHLGPYIILAGIIGLFVIASIGTSTLFKETPVTKEVHENADELIKHALQPFPAVRWTYNKTNGGLLLLGHVATVAEKNQMLYNLDMLSFVKVIDDAGIIIDEGVWNEVNSLLASNPAWSGIAIYSPTAGQFIINGELKTRKQAEQLSAYLGVNFPYLDLLKKQIVVEEDIINQAQIWLKQANLQDITVAMSTGEVTLNGNIPSEKRNELNGIVEKIKHIPGVRVVSNSVRNQTAETGIMDLSDHYLVTGKSRVGDKFTVVINGRFLSEGDDLDGMTITKITADRITLKKDRDEFRINY